MASGPYLLPENADARMLTGNGADDSMGGFGAATNGTGGQDHRVTW
jgi:hypothetical protein